MNAVLLLVIIIGVSLQEVVKKAYNTRVSGGSYSFPGMYALTAMAFFIATSGGEFNFSMEALPYSIMFGVSYALVACFSLLAIGVGPLSLTSLVCSYALVMPTLYGIAALGEPVSFTLVLGLILLASSLMLINCEKKGEKKKLTLKWGLFVVLSFIGNGMCSTTQKMQQTACNGMYKNEFMIIALGIAGVLMLIVGGVMEKKEMPGNIRKGIVWFLICGIANGLVNFLVMTLTGRMPASVMFPLISAGGIVMTFLVSVFVYKERLAKLQLLGVALGVASIVFLNL